MRYLLTILVVISLTGTSWAFVEKLHPNIAGNGGGIPCNAIGAMLWFFIDPNGPQGAMLNSIIQREWVPGGWSEQDTLDNAAIVSLLNGQTLIEQIFTTESARHFCMLWEMGVDEFNNPQKYRLRLGLPAAP